MIGRGKVAAFNIIHDGDRKVYHQPDLIHHREPEQLLIDEEFEQGDAMVKIRCNTRISTQD